MNARTCQLCGKPLSRLRANEGDFCSKEHRSQYRLRAGMNRLQEANKVANLMRRRENPRQIAAAQLICNSAGAARLCEAPALLSSQAEPAATWPVFSVSGKPQMPVTSQAYRNPGPARMPGVANPRRPNSSRVRIVGNKNTLALPRHRVSMTAKLAQARISQLRAARPETKPRYRVAERLPHGKLRVEPGRGPMSLRRSDALGKVSIHQVTRACKVRTTPRKGNALRVSSAVGFRVSSAHVRTQVSHPTMRNAMVWPGTPYSTKPDGIILPAGPKLLRVQIPVKEAFCPPGPRPGKTTRFVQATIVAVPSSKPTKGARPPAKFSGVNWHPVDPRWAGMVPGPESAGFARRNGAHLFALSMQPFTIDTLRQFASAPILVREGPVGYPRVGIQDTLAGAILTPGSLPATSGNLEIDENEPNIEIVAAPAQKHEENFDNGWGSWTSGTADWKVDVAGVRTGSLALFNPSMDMIDYELEFLTRIDQKSISWVVRAASLSEYCRCTLTAVPGGELEFSHSVLFEGGEEPATVAPAHIAAKPKSALTIRTLVQGQTYTVTVNGAPMDTWTEKRLPMGGIGFIGTPEDRARLYWIRLSSTGRPGKEYRKK